MSISEELELDISGALASIEDLRGSLETLGDTVTVSINDAIGAVDVTPLVQNIQDAAESADVGTAITSDIQSVDTSPLTTGLDEAVTAADLGGSIDEALAAANVVVPIEADTSAIGDAVDEAIGSADTVVVIEADASSVGDSIDESVTSANTEIELTVADNGSIGDATDQLGQLKDGSEGANTAIAGLTGGSAALSSKLGALGPIGLAVGAGLGILFETGVKVAASFQRLEAVTGKFAKQLQTVRLGDFTASFDDLREKLGEGGSALREATATSFRFAQASGFSGKAAASFSNNLNAVAVGLTAANPSLGSAADLTGKLSVQLARGGPRLAKMGIDLNKVDIAARAATNAQKGLGDGVSVASLAFAGAQLAAERLGEEGLKKAIEQGSKNPIIQMRVLETAVKSFIAAAGAPLVAPGLEFFKSAEPALAAVAASIGQLALAALPTLTAGLQVAGVALGAIAEVIGAIPTPILEAAAAMLILNKATSLFAATKIGTSLGVLALEAGSAARGILGVGTAVKEGTIATRAFGAAQAGAGAALGKIVAFVNPLTVGIAALAVAYFQGQQRQKDLTAGIREFAVALDKGGAAAKRAREELAALRAIPPEDPISGFLNRQAEAISGISSSADIIKRIEAEQKKLTATQGLAERQATKLSDAQDHYRDVVAQFGPTSEEAARALAKVNGLQDKNASSTAAAEAALQDNTATTAEAVREQETLASRLRLGEAGFDRLGVSIAKGEIPAASFDAVAKNLGISVEDLGTIVDAVKAQIQQFADTVTSALPGLSDVFSELGKPQDLFKNFADAIADREKAIGDATAARQKLGESGTADAAAIAEADGRVVEAIADGDKKVADAQAALFDSVDPEVFLQKLQAQAQGIANFQANLATLVSEGFGNLAANLALQGPVVAGGITQALTSAQPQTLQSLNDLFSTTGLRAAEDFHSFAVSTFGPIVADGGKAATDQFGIAFNPAAAAGAATALIPPAILQQTDSIILAAQSVGFQLTEAFKGQVVRVPTVVAQSMIDAGVAVQVNKNSPLAEADRAGAEMTIKFTQAYNPAVPAAQRTLDAGEAVKGKKRDLHTGGKHAGEGLIEGIVEGLNDVGNSINRRLGDIAGGIVRGFGHLIGIGSPARVMIPAGRSISEGIAAGITAGIPDVDAALATLSKQTIEQFNATVVPTLQPVTLNPAVAAALPSVAAAATTAGTSGGFFSDRTAAGGVTIENLIIQTPAKDQTQVGIETAKQLRAESFRAGR